MDLALTNKDMPIFKTAEANTADAKVAAIINNLRMRHLMTIDATSNISCILDSDI